MRISSKVVVPPPCQRKSQAMTNTIGSDSEMQRFESFHYPRARPGGGPEPEELEAQDRPAGAPLAPDRTLRAAGRSWRSPFKPTRSRKLGYELLKFGLRPSATSTGAHVTLRPKCECKFCDVVSVGSVYDDKEVVLAGREIDLLDFNSHFLGQLLRGFSSLRSVLD